jgi:hypothetical protein
MRQMGRCQGLASATGTTPLRCAFVSPVARGLWRRTLVCPKGGNRQPVPGVAQVQAGGGGPGASADLSIFPQRVLRLARHRCREPLPRHPFTHARTRCGTGPALFLQGIVFATTSSLLSRSVGESLLWDTTANRFAEINESPPTRDHSFHHLRCAQAQVPVFAVAFAEAAPTLQEIPRPLHHGGCLSIPL